MVVLQGCALAGSSLTRERIENDYYATPYESTRALLDIEKFEGDFIEPCVGGGHIANAINDFFTNKRAITGLDLVDRGYPNTIVQDFLTWETDKKFEGIITNPPFSLAQEFIEKGMELLTDDGQMAMFLKIQFLEGAKRKEFFEKYPPKYIYVFRNRMATWNNGNEIDPNTGKRWATTMCHAWFIWEKGSKTEPVVRWL